MMLPLLIFSLERMIDKRKPALYGVFLVITIVTNYYLGYMSCLFAVLYYFYWTMRKTDFSSVKDYFSKTFDSLKQFALYSVLGGLMSMWILLPAVAGMLTTGKTKVAPLTFAPIPRFGLDVLMQIGFDNTNFNSRLGHLPSIFSGSLVVVLCVVFFYLKSVSNKEKKLTLAMFIALFASFFIQLFNAVWHMFQNAAGFPYRNSYMFSFFMVVVAFEVWQKREEVERKVIWKIVSVLTGLMTVGYLANFVVKHFDWNLLSREQPTAFTFVISVLAFFFTAFLLTQKMTKRNLAAKLLLVMIVLEMGGNFYQMIKVIPFGDTNVFKAKEEKVTHLSNELLAKTRKHDKEFYRVSNHIPIIDNGYNQSLLSGYAAIPNYSSTLNNELRLSLRKLGFYSKNERRISDVGATQFMNYLFDVKYQFSTAKWAHKAAELETSNHYVYEYSEQNPSIGYAMSNTFSDVPIKYMAAFDNQSRLAKSIMKDERFEIFHAPKLSQVSDHAWDVTANTDGEMYIYLPHEKNSKIKIFMNNKRVEDRVFVRNRAILRLGNYKEGETIRVQIDNMQHPELIDEAIRTMSASQLEKVTKNLEASRLKLNVNPKNDDLKGTVVVEKGEELFLSIPYDKDWQVLIDGKKVQAKVALGAFMSVPVSTGTHKIEVRYVSKPFLLGVAMSLVSFILFVVLAFTNRRNRKSLTI
jgi:uncharacterized membrane protein YfhO